MNKLWFLGGITAAVAIVVAGVSLASAAITPSSTDTVAPVVKSGCGCGQKAACGGNCASGKQGACGAGCSGGFVDANKNGVCDKME